MSIKYEGPLYPLQLTLPDRYVNVDGRTHDNTAYIVRELNRFLVQIGMADFEVLLAGENVEADKTEPEEGRKEDSLTSLEVGDRITVYGQTFELTQALITNGRPAAGGLAGLVVPDPSTVEFRKVRDGA